MLTDEGSPEKVHIISQYLELLQTDPDSEYRYEDEDWFEGKVILTIDSLAVSKKKWSYHDC